MRIDRARIHIRLTRPNRRQQLFPCQHTANILQKHGRKIEFALRQIDIGPAKADSSPRQIQLDLTITHSLRPARLAPTQQGIDAGEKLHVTDGLRDVVVSPQAQNIRRVLFFSPCRADNNRHIPALKLANLANQNIATHIRQNPVHDVKIEMTRPQHLKKRRAVGKNLNLIAFTLQERLEHFGLTAAIFDNSKIHRFPSKR